MFGNRLERLIVVEKAAAAFAVDALAFAHLIPHLRAKKHLAAEAALALDAGYAGAARGRDAVVIGEQVFVDQAAQADAGSVQLVEARLLFRGLLACPFFFPLDKSFMAGQVLTRLRAARLQLLGAFHTLQLNIFKPADFGLRKSDFVLQRVELFVGLDAARLVAKLGDLLLLILDIALKTAALGFFCLNGPVGLLDNQGLRAQFFFNCSKVARQGCNGLPKLCDLYIGFLEADKVFQRIVHHLKVQSSTHEAS